MPTKLKNREIYWTAYCCLDGEECDLTDKGFVNLIEVAMEEPTIFLPELYALRGIWLWVPDGSPGWSVRKEILLRAMEMTY